MENDIYSLYCPLRNYLRKQRLDESLLGIHSHMQFQEFHQTLPNYLVGVPIGYANIRSFSDLLNYHVFPWELSILCKEIILNSPKYGQSHSLLNWHYLSGAINKLKELEDNISKTYSSKDNVLLEMSLRIPHRQFHWQNVPTMDNPARYWKIFRHKDLHPLIIECVGLDVEDIIKIGLGLLGVFQNKIALFYPPRISIPGIDNNKLDKFLEHFSLDFENLKTRLQNEQQYNNKFAYSYSSLIAYPIIRAEWEKRDAIICPIPRYLLERVTEGLYYEVCNSKGFDHAFGNAFQDYIGAVIKKLYTNGEVFPEAAYGKVNKTVDWLMVDGSAILFVECKTKRLTLGAKMELFNLKELDEELGKMADAIVQTYKTIADYKEGLYPQIKFDPNKKIFPLIITLENWFLYGDPLLEKLENLVVERLKKFNLPIKLIKLYPYCVMSAETFEKFVLIANENNITAVLEEKLKDQDKKYWEIDNYLRSRFPELVKNTSCPFKEELEYQIKNMIGSV